VRLSKSAHYALLAALEMALATDPVTVARVASQHNLPEGALAKVFQMLVHAGIARGIRGAGGGYRLARPAAETNVLQVIEVFDPPTPPHSAGGPARDPVRGRIDGANRLRQLFREVDELTRATFASVTLETLTGRRRNLVP
jgi:Rrf2 family protein